MDEKNNPHVLGELSRYLDGKLSGADRRRVEVHLESCEMCRKHNEGLLSMRNLLQQTPSLMPQQSFFHALIPSARTFKILFLIGVAAVVLWAVRKNHKASMDMAAVKPPVKAVVRTPPPPPPVSENPAPIVAAPREDPAVQNLTELANTLPPPTTAATIPAPAVVPDTAPVIAPAAP